MFSISAKNKDSRKGKFQTKHGVIQTPFFMPDATRGFVKDLSQSDLKSLKMGPMVVNTYHLFLQPGMELIKKAGGIHQFMNWQKPLLSDSGGYQVFSLIHKNPAMGKITDEKVIFRSPVSGELHEITPEKAIQIQFDLGVDMMVCLDDPPPNTDSKKKIAEAVERTLRWAERCMIEYKRQLKIRKIKGKDRPLIFCVIQGGEFLDLRKRCVEGLIEIGFSAKGGPALGWDGYGFGARHVDQDGKFLAEVLRYTASLIPEKALRFALGVGTPEDIVKCFSFGWDMFDCVIPTREGRHGRLFVWKNKLKNLKVKGFYKAININNQKFKNDFQSIDKGCTCYTCQNFTKAYLNHLFKSKDPLAGRLASIHNLKFYLELVDKLRGDN
jgi:queuine tRNA-ribosyltransferase